jgi:hypothetical protein
MGVTRDQLRGASYRPLGSGLYRWVGLKERPQLMLNAVSRRLPDGTSRRAGASVRRFALGGGKIVRRRGLPTTSALRTVVDLGGRNPLTEGVVVADLVLHAGLITIAELRAYVADHARAKGIGRLRRVNPTVSRP